MILTHVPFIILYNPTENRSSLIQHLEQRKTNYLPVSELSPFPKESLYPAHKLTLLTSTKRSQRLWGPSPCSAGAPHHKMLCCCLTPLLPTLERSYDFPLLSLMVPQGLSLPPPCAADSSPCGGDTFPTSCWWRLALPWSAAAAWDSDTCQPSAGFAWHGGFSLDFILMQVYSWWFHCCFPISQHSLPLLLKCNHMLRPGWLLKPQVTGWCLGSAAKGSTAASATHPAISVRIHHCCWAALYPTGHAQLS